MNETQASLNDSYEELNPSHQLEKKIKEFQQAMDRYHNKIYYQKIGTIVAIIIVSLQSITIVNFYQMYPVIHPVNLLVPFILAYLLSDFVNGLVHMIMDNNTHYNSIIGPLIAVFHLHHLTPRYSERHPLKVYFFESGTKNWLVVYLVGLALLQHYCAIPITLNFGLVCIGVLSSIAEVSHYWCHNSQNKHWFIQLLQNNRILLSKHHHRIHHTEDNKNYAFLNGLSDPIINIIAHNLYSGYKSNSDLHAKAYKGPQTNNRR